MKKAQLFLREKVQTMIPVEIQGELREDIVCLLMKGLREANQPLERVVIDGERAMKRLARKKRLQNYRRRLAKVC